MTVGLFDESLGLEKSLDGFGFLGQKFEACFSADPAETEVANHAVNKVLFILGPVFVWSCGRFPANSGRASRPCPRSGRDLGRRGRGIF